MIVYLISDGSLSFRAINRRKTFVLNLQYGPQICKKKKVCSSYRKLWCFGGVGLIDYSNSAAGNAVHWIFGFKIPVSLLKIFP